MTGHGTSIGAVKDFAGRVAVVTGGASGIGRALADAFASRSMKVVIADVETSALEQASCELRARGAEVMSVALDVRDREAVGRLAGDVYARYGSAHILCNNAGVGRGGFIHESTLEEWDWVLDVNLRGVVYGLHHFLPRMLKSGEPCHIVNTASIAGLVATAGLGSYNASKYAVVGISETLAGELAGTNVGVSVLCPAWVATRIMDSERNAPEDLRLNIPNALGAALSEEARNMVRQGLAPSDVAERTIRAIENGSLYVLSHPEFMFAIEERFRQIMNSRP
jgi:NAD(P)-dependent dehydrogenase (short-subunit alcohol dehydrogenase family)